MIHKIHAGPELASTPGADGIVWDNPATPIDESADNGKMGSDGVRRTYSIWNYVNARTTWPHVEFPAVIENCTKCHTGTQANVDNWNTKPSRAACGSCHDTKDFASPTTTHLGGQRLDDTSCRVCHGAGKPADISKKHDFTVADSRNISEYTPTITVNTPARGYFIAGESPVVSISLKDAKTGVSIDMTTVAEDTVAEGCWTSYPPAKLSDACDVTADALFRSTNFFVHGPRGHRMPVLTTAARSQVQSATTGPWDLSAAGATLVLIADQGDDVMVVDSHGADSKLLANVTVPATGTFANKAAATADEVVAWLNADAKFKLRFIAAKEASGKVSVRSRNLGVVHALQLASSNVDTVVFGGDVALHMPPGFYGSNTVAQRTNPANNDPKVAWTTSAIKYTLDPVDDLEPGTYLAGIAFTNRGSVSTDNFVAPTVGKVPFQVKTATEELPPAANCGSCHLNATGQGMMFDPYRHQKVLNDQAVDQCGECHDYQPQAATGATFSGAIPISRRVHAVHDGANLMYPNTTVSHADTIPGRNWGIEFPQDVRNCETCHAAGVTSGSWKTQPSRLPCGGCHDADAATAHMTTMTYDPTPANPWSGDEQEACETCHAP